MGFPGEPYEKASGTTPCADHEAGWVLPDRSTGYWVNFCDYPAGTMTDVIPTRMLESKQAAALDALGATLVTSKEIALDGHPGQEFTAMSPDGTSFAVRMYLVGDRLYKQDTNSKQPNASDIATFFDSFRFTSR